MSTRPLVDALARVGRSRYGRRLIAWGFTRVSFLFDVLFESDTLIAMRHPQPSYPTHILLVPKRRVPSFHVADDDAIVAEIARVARELVLRLGLERVGYRLIINGGPYQDIPQLHAHLISERPTRRPVRSPGG